MPDEIKITILQDGTIKSETSRISAANHLSAEAFMRESAKLAGGKVETKHKHGTLGLHHHHHGHEHDHVHH